MILFDYAFCNRQHQIKFPLLLQAWLPTGSAAALKWAKIISLSFFCCKYSGLGTHSSIAPCKILSVICSRTIMGQIHATTTTNFKFQVKTVIVLIVLFKYNVWILLEILVLIFDIFDVWYFKTKSCSISIRLFFGNYMKIFSFWLALCCTISLQMINLTATQNYLLSCLRLCHKKYNI